MGTLVYKGYNVGYRANLVVPPTQYTAVSMTASQYANIAALCAAKSLVAGSIFYSVNGTDTADGALAAARAAVLKSRNLTLTLPYDAYLVNTGATSVTYVQEPYLTQDVIPQCQSIDLLIGQTAAAAGDTGLISVYTFDQLVAAVAAAPANAVIKLADALFDFTDTLTITQPMTIFADRNAIFMNSSVAMAGPLVSVELAAQTAEANVVFRNISFYNLTATYDNVKVNNTTVAQKLKVYFVDCTTEIQSSTGSGLNVAHATANKVIEVHAQGRKTHKFHNVKIVSANTGDLFEFVDVRVLPVGSATDGITTTSTAQGTVSLKQCEVRTGHAANDTSTGMSYSLLYSWSDDNNGTFAKAAVTDLTNPAAGSKIVP